MLLCVLFYNVKRKLKKHTHTQGSLSGRKTGKGPYIKYGGGETGEFL